MAFTPERERAGEPAPYKEVPDEIPEYVEKSGISPTKTTFTAQVTDDKGGNLISTPQNQKITIKLPSDKKSLQSLSKGKITDSVTWFAVFWLRVIKKAAHFGWKVIKGEENAA